MSKLKSKIDFKPSTMDYFDCEKLPNGYIADEIRQMAEPMIIDYEKLLLNIKHRRAGNSLIFASPKKSK